MRIQHTVDVGIAEDSDMKDPLFGPFDPTLAQTQIDGYTNLASGVIKVAANSSKVVPFGDVQAVKGIYLEVNTECSVKINDTLLHPAVAIPLRRGNTSTGALAKFFMEADLDKVEIFAGVSNAVQGTFCVWGDPAT